MEQKSGKFRKHWHFFTFIKYYCKFNFYQHTFEMSDLHILKIRGVKTKPEPRDDCSELLEKKTGKNVLQNTAVCLKFFNPNILLTSINTRFFAVVTENYLVFEIILVKASTAYPV